MQDRLSLLNTWLKLILRGADEAQFKVEPVAGDASFRRYFRVITQSGKRYIAMDAPPEKEDCKPFIAVTRAWSEHGIAVPKIYSEDITQGFLLLEDFGDTQLFDRVDQADSKTQSDIYTTALEELQKLQALPVKELEHDRYDRALLTREVKLFSDWLITEAISIKLTSEQTQVLEAGFDVLIDNALSQELCVVHRDYHSRNLMIRDDEQIGVIDFQDAVIGPYTYDLVSLLRDCYIRLNPELIKDLALGFKSDSASENIRALPEQVFLRHFDLMGVQRHMKAAGIFARLALRDGKLGYLQDILRTFSYITEVCSQYKELQALATLLNDLVEPKVRGFIRNQAPLTKTK